MSTDTNASSAAQVFLILSGKGGVGKSTVSTSIALSLARKGCNVGILDIDLTGPSIPKMLGVSLHRVHQGSRGWVPVNVPVVGTGSLQCMSIGFLLEKQGDAVIWRGPKKTAMIRQFLQDVDWGTKLTHLIIDTPPGTGDEHIALVESLREGWKIDGAVLVTTPQEISVADVRKELSFCQKVGIHILGIIENMSGYVCPHCAECTYLFSKGGGEALAKQHNFPFLGHVPIDPNLVSLIESNVPVSTDSDATVGGYVAGFGESGVAGIFDEICEKLCGNAERK